MVTFEKIIDQSGYVDITPARALQWTPKKRTQALGYIPLRSESSITGRLYITPHGRVISFSRRPLVNGVNYGCYRWEYTPDFADLARYISGLRALNVPCFYILNFIKRHSREDLKNGE